MKNVPGSMNREQRFAEVQRAENINGTLKRIAVYFAKEKFADQSTYHLNLYAVDDNGDEILMTKDHIMPRSKCGIDDISNYQTMCKLCNEAKGNKLED